MKIAGLFLLPLLAGYAFSVVWAGSRYIVSREDGNRLYFRAGFYALFMYAYSFLIHYNIKLYFPSYFSWYIGTLTSFLNLADCAAIGDIKLFQASVAVFSIPVSLALGHFLNGFTLIKNLAIHYAIRNDDFEKMLSRSLRNCRPISVTLASGKVYIGFVVRSYEPLNERKDLRILPLLSGYRTKSMKLVVTTNYKHIYDGVHFADQNDPLYGIEIGDFEIVIACREIQTCNQFDLLAYDIFQKLGSNDEKQASGSIAAIM